MKKVVKYSVKMDQVLKDPVRMDTVVKNSVKIDDIGLDQVMAVTTWARAFVNEETVQR